MRIAVLVKDHVAGDAVVFQILHRFNDRGRIGGNRRFQSRLVIM